jgi:hypothetical protein
VAMLWRRQPYTVIYNIEPAVLDELLPATCARLGLDAVRVGNRVNIYGTAAELDSASGAAPATMGQEHGKPVEEGITAVPALAAVPMPALTSVRAPATERPVEAKVDLDPFPSARHVTLHWRRAHGTIRQDVEAELDRHFAEIETSDNPAANWLLTIASCLFSVIFLGLVGFVLLLMKR